MHAIIIAYDVSECNSSKARKCKSAKVEKRESTMTRFNPENADAVNKFVFRYLKVISNQASVHIFIQSPMHDLINNLSS